MGLKVIGAGFKGTGTASLREALSAPALLALAVLAGCAARAPESRPATPPAEAVPESAPLPASALTQQPEPVDVSIPASEYPQEALAANAEGSVVLKILIDETGRVREAKALRDPGYGFGEAAMRSALAHFRFKPGQRYGRPVATSWPFTVTYVLPGSARSVNGALAPAARVATAPKSSAATEIERWRAGCDGGDQMACNNLGFLIEEKQPEAAARLYAQACDHDVAPACHNIGYMIYRRGDLGHAIPAFVKACGLSHPAACDTLRSVMTAQARGTGHNSCLEIARKDGSTSYVCSDHTGPGLYDDPAEEFRRNQ
jgi:TonB family protein